VRKACTPFHQLADIARPFCNEDADCLLITETVAGMNRVSRVERRRVVRADCRGDPALRVPRVAFGRRRFGQDEDAPDGRERDGGAQACDAAADDNEIEAAVETRSWSDGQTIRMLS